MKIFSISIFCLPLIFLFVAKVSPANATPAKATPMSCLNLYGESAIDPYTKELRAFVNNLAPTEVKRAELISKSRKIAKERYTRKGLMDFVLRELSEYQPGQKILFVGVGERELSALKEHFQKNLHLSNEQLAQTFLTVDIDPKEKPDLVADITQKGSLPRASADFIVMLEVIAHLKEPQPAFHELHAALKPGGKLIFSSIYGMPMMNTPYHAANYTNSHLEYFLSNSGFESPNIIARNNWAEAIGGIITRLLRESDRDAQDYALRYLYGEESRWLENLGQRTGGFSFTTGWYGSAKK